MKEFLRWLLSPWHTRQTCYVLCSPFLPSGRRRLVYTMEVTGPGGNMPRSGRALKFRWEKL